MKIESIAASQLYGQAQKIGKTSGDGDATGFADALQNALKEMHATVGAGEKAAADAMAGTGDLQSVVEALTQTEMALETATVVRDKVVEAYQEIMRMPV